MAKRTKTSARAERLVEAKFQRVAPRNLPPKAPDAKPTFPVAAPARGDQLAPPPLVDRYPLVVGSNVTFAYVASVARLATTGYRQQLVDLLRELVENDPHLASVLQKRILSVANGRFEVEPVDLDEDHPDHAEAVATADMVRAEVARIPNFTQARATLLWAIYYGCSAAEIVWCRDGDGWHVDRLEFVHTRRLAWPDSQSWDAYVWDQGQVYGWDSPWGESATNSGVFGLKIADWPGKFVFYAPQLSGDYPTRDGLGRQVMVWSLMKRVAARGATDYLERFAKGFVDVAYKTADPDKPGEPRPAEDKDIDLARQLAQTLGIGNGNSAVHPDCITLTPTSFDGTGGGGKSKLTWSDWIAICNSEESKAVLGSTLGTDVGKGGGNRALGEVQERGEVDLEQYDATTLAETLRRDIFAWLVRLNRPQSIHLVPHCRIHVDVEPDPESLVATATAFVKIGAPVDLDVLAGKLGMPLVDNETDKPRRAYASDVVDPLAVDESLMSEEARKQKADAADAAQKLLEQKAKQPVAGPLQTNGAASSPSKTPTNPAGSPAEEKKPS